MRVIDLSLRLTRIDPSFDSMSIKEDGKTCRDIIVEERSGVKVLARIDETKENKYTTDFNGFKSISKEHQEALTTLLDKYCKSPVAVRLAK